jgi:hypothetical protein
MKHLQSALLILAIAAMTAGILRGELTDIFRKATMLCLECIGIG